MWQRPRVNPRKVSGSARIYAIGMAEFVYMFVIAWASATPVVPTQTFFSCEKIQFWMENHFAFPPKDCTLLHIDFLGRQEEIIGFSSETMRCKLRSDAFLKSFSKSAWSGKPTQCKRAQPISINYALLITKSALCLGQSAFSNFAFQKEHNCPIS